MPVLSVVHITGVCYVTGQDRASQQDVSSIWRKIIEKMTLSQNVVMSEITDNRKHKRDSKCHQCTLPRHGSINPKGIFIHSDTFERKLLGKPFLSYGDFLQIRWKLYFSAGWGNKVPFETSVLLTLNGFAFKGQRGSAATVSEHAPGSYKHSWHKVMFNVSWGTHAFWKLNPISFAINKNESDLNIK